MLYKKFNAKATSDNEIVAKKEYRDDIRDGLIKDMKFSLNTLQS